MKTDLELSILISKVRHRKVIANLSFETEEFDFLEDILDCLEALQRSRDAWKPHSALDIKVNYQPKEY